MDKEKEDRISLLPDCLLLEIISRIKIMDKRKEVERLMTTKEVIKTTSTISKRWQHLWTILPTLVFISYDDITDLCYKYNTDLTDYFSFIDKTLTQCPTDVNLKKIELLFIHKSLAKTRLTSQVNSWIRHAITRNVQEVKVSIYDEHTLCDGFSIEDELFFNNSCLMSMKLSHCVFNPLGDIRWDKLMCLCIDYGKIDIDSVGKILCGSPCLETLELKHCNVFGRIHKALFGNFGVEQLSCGLQTYERFNYVDELFFDSYSMSMKLSRYIFNPPNGAILLDKLKFLRIDYEKLDEDSIGKILSGCPCLETLELNCCSGVRRIDVTSESVKNLVLDGYDFTLSIDTIKINAPYILSLTIKESLYVKKIFLLNVSSLVKADLDYEVSEDVAEERVDEIEEKLLRGLLRSLDHVNEIALGKFTCYKAFSRLEAKGFQFRKGSDRRIDPHGYLVFL